MTLEKIIQLFGFLIIIIEILLYSGINLFIIQPAIEVFLTGFIFLLYPLIQTIKIFGFELSLYKQKPIKIKANAVVMHDRILYSEDNSLRSENYKKKSFFEIKDIIFKIIQLFGFLIIIFEVLLYSGVILFSLKPAIEILIIGFLLFCSTIIRKIIQFFCP